MSISEIITALKCKKLIYDNQKYQLLPDRFHGKEPLLIELNLDDGFFLFDAKTKEAVARTEPAYCEVKNALNNLIDICMKEYHYPDKIACMGLLWFNAKRGFLDEFIDFPNNSI